MIVFNCRMTSGQMTEKIVSQMFFSNGSVSEESIYSVKEYADFILEHQDENEEYKTVVPLVKALLNYGGFAQQYFQYDVTDLANQDLQEADQDLSSVGTSDFSGFEDKIEGEVEGIHYLGSSLILRSNTTIRHYFYLDDGYKIGDYRFYLGDKELVSDSKGDYFYVDINDIPSGRLLDEYSIVISQCSETTATELEIRYNAMCYVKEILRRNESERLKNLAKALYVYGREAAQYFNRQ